MLKLQLHAYDYEFENLHRYGMAKEFTVVGIQNYNANFNIGFQPANKDQMVDIFYLIIKFHNL